MLVQKERDGLQIFDAHCDVLMKMYNNPKISFHDSHMLQVNKKELKGHHGKVQAFAIYIPESVHPELRFPAALNMVDIFYESVLMEPEMKLIRSKADISALQSDQIGALLTLEGCDCIGQDIGKLKVLLQLGVSSVGLTWNYANAVADGALEPRGAGISLFGKEVITLLNQQLIWCDVSHLSEAAFWDTMEIADYPIASHSNVFQLCPHPRNLKDNQLQALFKKNGVIGITFVPQFLTEQTSATIADILRHIDYVASRGGDKHIGLGSDFDGIDTTVEQLASFRQYPNLINELQKHFSENFVNSLLFDNFVNNFPK